MGIILYLKKLVKKIYSFFLGKTTKDSKEEVIPTGFDKTLHKKILLALLANTQGIGYNSLRAVYPILDLDYRTFTQTQFIAQLPSDLRNKELIMKSLQHPNLELYEKIKKRYFSYRKNGTHFIVDKEHAFPANLSRIKRPAYWLFVQGELSLLQSKKIIAVVGTRRPSPWSLEITQRLTEFLVSNDYVILSGLAPGIDSMAHATAVKKQGKTIAVLGHGVEVKLSYENSKLKDEILDTGGAVITEYFPKTSYSRNNFILRNRIQTAIALGVVPIECKKHSGTTHTVNYALEQNKKLFTIIYDNVYEKQNDVYQLMKYNRKHIFSLPLEYPEMMAYLTNNDMQYDTVNEKSQLSLDL